MDNIRCRCDVGLLVRCWVVGAMLPRLRSSKIDVSTFEDG